MSDEWAVITSCSDMTGHPTFRQLYESKIFTIIQCERSACFHLSFYSIQFLYRAASFPCRTARGQTHEIYCLEPSRAGVSYIDYGNTETTVQKDS